MNNILNMDKDKMEQLVLTILMVIVATITALCMCNIIRRIDFTPATPSEWNYLYEQVTTFKENGIEQFYTTEDIKLIFEENSVKIESEQCGVILEVEEKNSFKEVENYDKAYLNWDAVVLIIALVFASVIVSTLLFFVEVVVIVIYLKYVQLLMNFAKKTYKR